jgi:L-rhamnose mutarotase
MKTQRYGSVVRLKDACIDEYRRVHAEVWPGVIAAIKHANISNYSIYLRKLPDGGTYLFSYFEYAGTDFAADMARMAEDPTTQAWWALCKPMHEPFADRAPGEWWASAEEIFHCN